MTIIANKCVGLLAVCSYSIFSEFNRKTLFDTILTQGWESLTACLFSLMNQRVYELGHIFCSDLCFLLHLLKSCELFLQNLFEGGKKPNKTNKPCRSQGCKPNVIEVNHTNQTDYNVTSIYSCFSPPTHKIQINSFFSLFITCSCLLQYS